MLLVHVKLQLWAGVFYHVCGLLFAVIDYTEKYGYMPRACTSLPWLVVAYRNSFIINLQSSTASRPGAVPCMWETILTLGYDDYSLDAEEQSVLQIKCHQLVANLSVGTCPSIFPVQIVEEQQSDMQRGGCCSQHPLARLLCIICRLTDQLEIS